MGQESNSIPPAFPPERCVQACLRQLHLLETLAVGVEEGVPAVEALLRHLFAGSGLTADLQLNRPAALLEGRLPPPFKVSLGWVDR